LHLWLNLLGVFYLMPLGGRIASEIVIDFVKLATLLESYKKYKGYAV